MDAPYRLLPLLKDVADVFGDSRRVCIAFDLTMPTEEILHGTAPKLFQRLSKENRKGEFVLIIEGRESR